MLEKTGAIRYLLTALLTLGALAQAQGTLDIYTIDVEGGNATLFVAPSGESLLIDTGNAGNQASRDAARILEATQAAGLKQIDHHPLARRPLRRTCGIGAEDSDQGVH
jgi:beta-lactamase superfamily II metal-dependent hydrolase